MFFHLIRESIIRHQRINLVILIIIIGNAGSVQISGLDSIQYFQPFLIHGHSYHYFGYIQFSRTNVKGILHALGKFYALIGHP